MLRIDPQIDQVFLHRAPVDMRRGFDGLATIVAQVLGMDPFGGALYLFTNKRKDRIKILAWIETGFAIYYHRLEQEKFKWPARLDEQVIQLSGEQLKWLLGGYDVWRMKPHKVLHFKHIT